MTGTVRKGERAEAQRVSVRDTKGKIQLFINENTSPNVNKKKKASPKKPKVGSPKSPDAAKGKKASPKKKATPSPKKKATPSPKKKAVKKSPVAAKTKTKAKAKSPVAKKATEEVVVTPIPGIEGKSFIITGTLTGITRDAAKAQLLAAGAKIGSSVTKNTSYLVAGTDEDKGTHHAGTPSNKRQKAEELGVKIIDEATLLEMMNP